MISGADSATVNKGGKGESGQGTDKASFFLESSSIKCFLKEGMIIVDFV